MGGVALARRQVETPSFGGALRRVLPAVGMFRLALVGSALAATTSLRGQLLERFFHTVAVGDSGWYVIIAKLGYQRGAPSATHAFLPGYPLALRGAGAVFHNPVTAGMVVSGISAVVALTALWRLAASEHCPKTADRAVRYFLVFPFAVFLFVAYTEALFLALAFSAIVASRDRRWTAAALFATGATMTRTVGLAVALAIVVEWWIWRRATRSTMHPAVILSAPFVGLGVYVAWLHHLTGRWDAYNAAQRNVWHAGAAAPWRGFLNTLLGRVDPSPWGPFALLAVAAVVGGIVLTVALARRGRLSDATLVGVSSVLVAGSANYAAAGRTALLWWPLFVAVAAATAGRDALHRRIVGWGGGALIVTALCLFSGLNVG